jgi:hypothetical protein
MVYNNNKYLILAYTRYDEKLYFYEMLVIEQNNKVAIFVLNIEIGFF